MRPNNSCLRHPETHPVSSGSDNRISSLVLQLQVEAKAIATKDARIKSQNCNLEEVEVGLLQRSRRVSHALGTAAQVCFPTLVTRYIWGTGKIKDSLTGSSSGMQAQCQKGTHRERGVGSWGRQRKSVWQPKAYLNTVEGPGPEKTEWNKGLGLRMVKTQRATAEWAQTWQRRRRHSIYYTSPDLLLCFLDGAA